MFSSTLSKKIKILLEKEAETMIKTKENESFVTTEGGVKFLLVKNNENLTKENRENILSEIITFFW